MAAVIAGLLWIVSGGASVGWLLCLHCTDLGAQHFGDLSQSNRSESLICVFLLKIKH